MFVDEVKVFARAGHGGRGAIAFRREAYIPKGGPSGGNGGLGGDVILEASHDLNNLIEQFFNPRMLAQHGENGMGKGMDGKAGKDMIIKVPCGTLVWLLKDTTPQPELKAKKSLNKDAADDGTEEEEPESEDGSDIGNNIPSATETRGLIRTSGGVRAMEIDLSNPDTTQDAVDATKRELVCDLTEHGQRFVLCKGGRGGLGNSNFATSRHQAPRFAQPGEPGREGHFLFELRLIADVGLVGYPNAGKSTLLAAISHARPKIAAYPFTTLTPQIGIVEYPDFARLVVCDVPGLIEGAHENVGLGHEFLRHIRRCKILVILVDMAGTDNRLPWDDYRKLLGELELYDPELLTRPRLVVANKMDEPHSDANLKSFKRRIRKTVVLPISAAFGEGMPAFRQAIREAVEEAGGTLLK
jgi:GTP-binding protein